MSHYDTARSSVVTVGAFRDEFAIIYGLVGAEHVCKLMMCFAAKGVPFVLQKVHNHRSERAKYMPRKTLESDKAYPYFPVVRFPNGEVVVETSDICLYLDKHYPDRPMLYPEDMKTELLNIDKQISNGLLYQGSLYLACESREVFEKFTERKFLPKFLPNIFLRVLYKIPGFHQIILNEAYKSWYRNEGTHNKWVKEMNPDIAKRWLTMSYTEVTENVIEEYGKYDEMLAASSTPYFLNSEHPTAPDFMLYSLYTRIGGTNLGLCDPYIGPYEEVFSSYPALLKHADALESGVWARDPEGYFDLPRVPYKWSEVKTFTAKRLKPLGIPTNPERCP